jgi:hypothetical protein
MANGFNAVPDAITLVDAPIVRKFTATATILLHIRNRDPTIAARLAAFNP